MQKKLGIYIHIPFCIKKCDYCDFLSMPAGNSLQDDYMNALLHEIEREAKFYQDYAADTVFIGGGTPSVLQPEWTEALLQSVKTHFRILPDAEISMEVNPGTVTKEKLERYFQAGINRLSIGMQSADNRTLCRLGRIHTYEQFLESYEAALAAGFTNINVDIMSALPGQTLQEYCRGLEKVMQLLRRPSHISAYSLIIEEGTKFYERYGDAEEAGRNLPKSERLPDLDTDRRMYELTDEILRKYGYHRYEISNYALPGYECKHNKKYWQREPYVGFGIGAASFIGERRFKNGSDIAAYIRENGQPEKEEDMVLSVKEQMGEFMFLGLRLTEGISREAFRSTFGVSLEEVYGEEISCLKEQEVLEEGNTIKLTRRGLNVCNFVFANFVE